MRRAGRAAWRGGPWSTFALLALLFCGCTSTPTTRFHSLMAVAPMAVVAPATRIDPSTRAWELQSVAVPPQVDMPQLVVRRGDQTLAVLEDDRWIAPLAEEIRSAVDERLAAASLANPASGAAAPAAWQIGIDVRHFEAEAGRGVRLEAEWTIRAAQGPAPVLRCRGLFEQPVSPGVSAIVAGHRATVARLGDAIAATLAAMGGGAAPDCPGVLPRARTEP